tara:strand:- start:156 stop:437 length:282 start_codon:yes stop_codon:yes gene_type:complete
MKLYARFANLYGWCPSPRGISHGEMELGLMVNMKQVEANKRIGMTQSIGACFSGDAMSALMEQAGASEKELVKHKMESFKAEMQSNRGNNQWQ